MHVRLLLAWLLAFGSVSAAEPKVKDYASRPGANQALAVALDDVRRFSHEARPYIRYVWVMDDDPDAARAVSLAINYISKASLPIPLEPLRVDKLLLMRVDLRRYAPDGGRDLKQLIDTFEKFDIDPRFVLLLTKDTIQFAVVNENAILGLRKQTLPAKSTVRELVTVWQGKKPKLTVKTRTVATSQTGWVPVTKKTVLSDFDVVKADAEHIDQKLFRQLQDACHTAIPVVSHEYFVTRTLSTIQDDGLFKEIWGGLYYEFRVAKGGNKGTDEDKLFESLGIGNVAQGVTAEKLFKQILGSQRLAIFRSKVTAHPRAVDLFRSPVGRPDDQMGLVSVTHDLKRKSVDIGTHPIFNLLKFKDDAREVIYELPNGLHGFDLFDGNGKRQNEVPNDVAKDHDIPRPFDGVLQPAISCIRCHGPHDGWQPVANDVVKLLTKGDIFDDIGDSKRTQHAVVDELFRKYSGNFAKAFSRGRMDYSHAILRSTGPWPSSKAVQTDIVRLASEKIVSIWSGYWYDGVDADTALREIGIIVERGKGADFIDRHLKPVPRDLGGFFREDPRILALKAGLDLNRTEYDLIHSFFAARMYRSLGISP